MFYNLPQRSTRQVDGYFIQWDDQHEKGNGMTGRVARACGVVGVSLSMLSFVAAGCGKDQTPPAQTAAPAPPAATTQAAPPVAGTPVQSVNQLQIGMTSEQVQQFMGAPGRTKQEGTETEWEYYTPQGKVEVKMLNNRVTAIERK